MAEIQKVKVRWPGGDIPKPSRRDTLDLVDKANETDLVVLLSSEIASHVKHSLSAVKPTYVLLADTSFEQQEKAWQLPGVIGCGSVVTGRLPSDLLTILDEMVKRRVAEEGIRDGVEPDPKPPAPGSFATLTLGRMRRFMAELNHAITELRAIRESWRLADQPFLGIEKANWLDAVQACVRPPAKDDKEAQKASEQICLNLYNAIMAKSKRANKKGRWAKSFLDEVIRGFASRFGWGPSDVTSLGVGRQGVEKSDEDSTRWEIPSLLLEGETGTGKTLLAKYIRSCLGDLPFRQITCTNIPEKLLETELFGSMAGAFTDSKVTREGKVLAAYGGVIFLDEIGDMPLELQVKLLALLNEGLIYPDGWAGPDLRIPVVIVAATNRNLRHLIHQQMFRHDLYYRFDRRLAVPPLRQRVADLEQFVRILLGREAQRTAGQAIGMSREALAAMRAYAFPGNFRELEHVLSNAVRQARRGGGRMVLPEDLCFEPPRAKAVTAAFLLPIRKTSGQREIILRWSETWGDYHFLGTENSLEEEPDDLLSTLVRGVEAKTRIELHSDQVSKLDANFETLRMAGDTGEQTWYRFHLFLVSDAALLNRCFALADRAGQPAATAYAPSPFVVASEKDIEKGFIHQRRISEAVQECWQRLDAEGLL
jgi:hypothetical protein